MRARLFLFCCVAGVATSLPLSIAGAGQVRIDVGPAGNTTSFVPAVANLNAGDQVVWVWGSGFHSVTEGIPCEPAQNALFDTGILASNATRFSWKSTAAGTVSYFCRQHCSTMNMTGELNITAADTPVSDFRITEVRYSTTAENNFVEIANLGGAAGNLGRYRLSVQAGSALDIPLVNVVVPVDGRVVIHFGVAGTNEDTDIYFETATLPPDSGSAALYLPNSFHPSLTDGNMIVDYVEWGAASRPNEATAAATGIWTAGEFAAIVPEGHSLEFCGEVTNRGASFWHEVSTPNPGVDGNCLTPVEPTTWGALKARFRR